jgi:hypothetical protein
MTRTLIDSAFEEDSRYHRCVWDGAVDAKEFGEIGRQPQIASQEE